MTFKFGLRLVLASVGLLLTAASATLHWRHELGFSGSDVLSFLPVATPQEAIEGMIVPPGFRVSVVAAEPDIAQPIGMATDAQGRLWVAECRTYPNWNTGAGDQVVIFGDPDAGGNFQSRSLFCTGLANLSGLEIGLGGVWLLCSPNLLFIPDRDADGRPDGPAQIVLDGWDDQPNMRPHVANSLTWGPDGWLYGCLGCSSNSLVGPPGTLQDRRVSLDAAVWRYHPKTTAFEVFASGTYNPWGLDFDETGELFISNSMVAHLWQIVPGGRYERQGSYVKSSTSYEWMNSCTNHNHWSGSDQRQPDLAKTQAAGGGHAHAGLVIYQGDNWPDHYRGEALLCNLQGRSINHDSLDYHQDEPLATHAGDMLQVGDLSFRGVDLECGPDGTLFVADWNARGNCLGSDTHASNPTGRIYRIAFGQPQAVAVDLDAMSDAELVSLHRHANVWFSRRARLVLQDRVYRNLLDPNTVALLAEMATDRQLATVIRLRAFWTWHVLDAQSPAAPEADLRVALLVDPTAELRAWAVRLSAETPRADYVSRWIELAKTESARRVRRELVSALHRLPDENRLRLATTVMPGISDLQPRNWQRLCWYAIEPLVVSQPEAIVELDKSVHCSFVNFAIARRIAEIWSTDLKRSDLGMALESLMDALPAASDDWRTATLQGLTEGLRANRASSPPAWSRIRDHLAANASLSQMALIASISAEFGESVGREELIAVARNRSRSTEQRLTALNGCLGWPNEAVQQLVLELSTDPAPAIRRKAILSMAAFDCDLSPLFSIYDRLTVQDRRALVEAATGRSSHARQLLRQVESDIVPITDIDASAARQLLTLNDSSVSARWQQCWINSGRNRRDLPAEQQRITQLIGPESLATANRSNGRAVFTQRCGHCHTLHGTGGTIGPNLTGSQRNDPERLIADVTEPSAVVGRQFQATLIQTIGGQVITGIVADETPQIIVLRTATDQVTIGKREIESQRLLPESLMPAGLLSNLMDRDVRDLFAYLMDAN